MSDHVLPSTLVNNFTEDYLLKLPYDFYKKTKSYLDVKDLKKIQKAYTFAFYSHEGQKRKDGSKYITHPVNVASILLERACTKKPINWMTETKSAPPVLATNATT